MQARRRAQPSGTNSPSSSHPRLKHRARCVIFFRARHAAARVAPDRGFLAGFIERPRGSAPRERDHRGGDHPVPSRTRQLSPPSPRVLQRKAAGGQGVALAEGAFLYARVPRAPRAQHAPGGARRGDVAPAGLSVFWGEGPRSGGVFRPLHRPACGGARARLAQGTRQECYARGPRDRSGNLPPCGPFLRYEVERCLPDASLVLSEVVLIQNEFAVSAVGYVGGFGCYLIVYET